MKRLAALLVALAAAVTFSPHAALGDDEPIFTDGGSLVTTTDGGSSVTADLGVAALSSFTMAIRCEGQAARYHLCATSTCTATTANQLLDADRTFDIPVNRITNGGKRYLALSTDDGGIPACKVQRNR